MLPDINLRRKKNAVVPVITHEIISEDDGTKDVGNTEISSPNLRTTTRHNHQRTMTSAMFLIGEEPSEILRVSPLED